MRQLRKLAITSNRDTPPRLAPAAIERSVRQTSLASEPQLGVPVKDEAQAQSSDCLRSGAKGECVICKRNGMYGIREPQV